MTNVDIQLLAGIVLTVKPAFARLPGLPARSTAFRKRRRLASSMLTLEAVRAQLAVAAFVPYINPRLCALATLAIGAGNARLVVASAFAANLGVLR